MIKRVRDKLRNLKPQEAIGFKEWQDISNRFVEATNFIRKENLGYTILIDDLREAERIVIDNRVHEVREIRVISDFVQKVFVTPKQEQLDELVGQIKYIRGYLAELQSWIDRKLDLEKMEADGKIVIHREEPRNEVS